LAQVNAQADGDESRLRLSLDTKARVWVGDYSRGGPARVTVTAADPEFQPEAKLRPFGLLLPQAGAVYLYFTAGNLTSDFIVDCLSDRGAALRERFPQVTTLGLNLDNGPENPSRRTQFMQRIIEFVAHFQVRVDLAYYPPYHSKYNPIERVWGVEKHWNGSLLDSGQTVLRFAQTLLFGGNCPASNGSARSTPLGFGSRQGQWLNSNTGFNACPV
jgi:transposase